MGDPKRIRKKFSKPAHPWRKERLDEEKELLDKYGLKNKKELWKAESFLRNLARQAKKLIAASTPQAEKEGKQLLDKLESLGLTKKTVEETLSLTLNDILERRLQTQVFRKDMAHSIVQARQFITHGHITIGDNRITSPSYIVSAKEESSIGFSGRSPLSKLDHPEREQIKPKQEKTDKKPKETEKKTEEETDKKPKKDKK